MDHETDRIAAQLVALGYIPPGLGPGAGLPSFWDEYGVAVGIGFVVLAVYVSLVVADYHATDRLPGDGDRNRNR